MLDKKKVKHTLYSVSKPIGEFLVTFMKPGSSSIGSDLEGTSEIYWKTTHCACIINEFLNKRWKVIILVLQIKLLRLSWRLICDFCMVLDEANAYIEWIFAYPISHPLRIEAIRIIALTLKRHGLAQNYFATLNKHKRIHMQWDGKEQSQVTIRFINTFYNGTINIIIWGF